MTAAARGQKASVPDAASIAQRLDKWLWFARVVKSRTQAAGLVAAGKIRVNRVRVTKPSQLIKPDDVITSSAQKVVRILRIKAPGERRGPPAEAQALYEELTERPVQPMTAGRVAGSAPPHSGSFASASPGVRQRGAGRPTKRDRRKIGRLVGED